MKKFLHESKFFKNWIETFFDLQKLWNLIFNAVRRHRTRFTINRSTFSTLETIKFIVCFSFNSGGNFTLLWPQNMFWTNLDRAYQRNTSQIKVWVSWDFSGNGSFALHFNFWILILNKEIWYITWIWQLSTLLLINSFFL